jgi:hypothetical protein
VNPGGVLLVLAGAVVIAQVGLGNALGRLGIAGDADVVRNVAPNGVPNQNPNLPYLRDENGHVL